MPQRALITCIAIAAFCAGPATAQNRGDCQGRQAETWSITVAGPDEPGQRMVVEGRVLEADGVTPIAGATVFVFQTDNEGYYSPDGTEESDARLCGLMLTRRPTCTTGSGARESTARASRSTSRGTPSSASAARTPRPTPPGPPSAPARSATTAS